MNEQPTTPKRFRIPSRLIGAIEVVNAVLLTLAGYSIGHEQTYWAIGISAAYAAGKNYIDRCIPTDPINSTTVSSPQSTQIP